MIWKRQGTGPEGFNLDSNTLPAYDVILCILIIVAYI